MPGGSIFGVSSLPLPAQPLRLGRLLTWFDLEDSLLVLVILHVVLLTTIDTTIISFIAFGNFEQSHATGAAINFESSFVDVNTTFVVNVFIPCENKLHC